MSDTRSALRALIKARLQGIRTGEVFTDALSGQAHTVETDIGARVLTWHMTGLNENQLPAIVFADGEAPSTLDGAAAGQQDYTLKVEIIAVQRSTDPSAAASAAIVDILAAVGSDPEWNGTADAWTELESTDIELDPQGRDIAYAIVRIAIHYSTCLWQG